MDLLKVHTLDMAKQMTNRPIIIAICGKSASGKDTLAKALSASISPFYDTNIIISDTTRPRRFGEKSGLNYNFISNKTFESKKENDEYLEYTVFRKWYYGTNKASIVENAINIGVFNVEGLINLTHYTMEYNIIPIYLDLDLENRLRRSYNRERKWKLEYFRRAFTDYRDFIDINKILGMYEYHLTLALGEYQLSTIQEVNVVRNWLTYHRILELPGQKWINLT